MLSGRSGSRLWFSPRWLWLVAMLVVLSGASCKGSGPDSSAAGGSSGAAGSGGAAGSSGAAGSGAEAGSGGAAGNTALPAPGPDSNAATRIAGALSKPCGPESTDAAIEALARSGIETYDDASGLLIMNVIPPARGLHVSRTQARGMGCEIASHGGTTGEQLDKMVGPLPLPDNSQLPVSALFAAYASTPGVFGSELAAVLMGNIEGKAPATLVFPSLVITTFLREVVVPMLAEAPVAAWRTPGELVTTLAADPCAAISQFLDDLPGAVSKAVGSLSPDEGSFWPSVFSIGAKIAGALTYATVAAAKTFVQHLPGMDALRNAMTAVGVVVDVRSMFTQWTLTVTAAPEKVHKSVGGATNTGQLILEVAPPEQGFDWPQQLKSCAALLAVPLPNLNGTEGATVVWTQQAGFPSPATQTSEEFELTSGKAAFTFKTVTEDVAIHNGGGAVKVTPAQVKIDVALPGLESLGSKIAGLTGSSLAAGAIGAGTKQAAQLIGPSTVGEGSVEYHEATAATIDVVIGGGMVLHLVSCAGVYGPYTGTATYSGGGVSGSAPASLSIDPGTNAGPLVFSIGFSGACSGNYDVNATATLGGSPTSPTVTFVGGVSGFITCPGGGGPLSDTFNGTFPIQLGASTECP